LEKVYYPTEYSFFCISKAAKLKFTVKHKIKQLSVQEAKAKTARYCAYQERSRQEVQHKLKDYGLTVNDTEQVLNELEAEGFYNDDRFARSFCRGKLHQNKWGKIKIVQALRQKGLSEDHIQSGLVEIEGETYRKVLSDLIHKKLASLHKDDDFARKHKAARYAIGKGFEGELVWEILGGE
jgi:regulatory protein